MGRGTGRCRRWCVTEVAPARPLRVTCREADRRCPACTAWPTVAGSQGTGDRWPVVGQGAALRNHTHGGCNAAVRSAIR
eukprot:361279-Chlamydomonas_euryale.AAC.3